MVIFDMLTYNLHSDYCSYVNRVVYCTSKLDDTQEFAMKIMRKALIKKEDKVSFNFYCRLL